VVKALKKLGREFYARPAEVVARELLGKTLVHGEVRDRIVEVEAYLPEGDAAAHVYRGRTERTRILFGPAGHAYLYLNYGMHWMLNISADRDDRAGCVLLRGTERFGGPGLLTRGFGLDGRHYGLDVCGGQLFALDAGGVAEEDVLVTPRIGITQAADFPLRYVARGFEKRKGGVRARRGTPPGVGPV